MTLPTFIPFGDELARSKEPYWAATSKGWMRNIPTLFGEAQLLSKETPSTLPVYPELFHFNGKRLPAHIMSQAHDFFRKVWEKQQTESSAYICHNPIKDTYKLFIPEQYVSMASVDHKLEPGAIKDGYRAVGTIHSHCDFSAYHSSVDTHDMEGMPGIHITIGHVDREEPEYAIALAIEKTRFDLEWDQIIDDEKMLDKNGYAGAPDWWMSFVHKGSPPWGKTGTVIQYKKPTHKTNNRKGSSYIPQFPQINSIWNDAWEMDELWYDWAITDPTPVKKPVSTGSKEKQEAFLEYEADIEIAEETIDFIVAGLAKRGFALSYTIHYAPKQAAKYLEQLTDEELLPELKDVAL